MSASSIARIKCYVILQGLERSLAENLLHNFTMTSPTFLNQDEKRKALVRLHEDIGDWVEREDDTQQEDLLKYLDIGDLVALLNRHIKSATNVLPEHISAASKMIGEKSVLSIRKRVMHPVRPLEPDDLTELLSLSQQIRKVAPSLIWEPMVESLHLLSSREALLDISIPTFWAENSTVIHNLPAAEFDDTGFIGRHKERKDLKALLSSDHRVITIVGEGGKGKTALGLRVCNEILEESNPLFERIVWISLKTRYLTPEGVRQISNAIDSVGALIDSVFTVVDHSSSNAVSWERVLDQMRATKTLLIIDNLETIGEEVRDLVLNIPQGSKVLMTSRIGLGEIELRYELGAYAPADAMHLFRSLASVYGYDLLQGLDNMVVANYCRTLGHNPLLIKWFVQAVGRGTDPVVLLSKTGFDEALNFCYANIYDKISPAAKQIVSILLAGRRILTKAQLQDLTKSDHVQFTRACQDLVRSSIVERTFMEDGTIGFQITGLVYEYMAKNHPPTDADVIAVRKNIQSWQAEQQLNIENAAGYRYGANFLNVENADERISAQQLRRAMQAARIADFVAAGKAVAYAQELTPTWSEVYRVLASISETQHKPIYEVEEAFERSIKCKDNDISRFHYAAFLLRQGEYDRVIDHIDHALRHEDCIKSTLLSIKGIALLRSGLIDESIPILREAYTLGTKMTSIPNSVKRAEGTQLADAFCRRAESMVSLGNRHEIEESCKLGIETVENTMGLFGMDHQTVETAVCLLGNIVGTMGEEEFHNNPLMEIATKWDRSAEFRTYSVGFRKTAIHFQRHPSLEVILPTITKALRAFTPGRLYDGMIRNIDHQNGYGFISCEELGDIHFNPSSLINPDDWRNLAKKNRVSFGVIVPLKRSLHAVSMKLLQPESLKQASPNFYL